MNIITIVSDTLRYDCVACHGLQPHGWELARPVQTPNLDRFAGTAAVFDNAYTGSFPTIPMRTDMFTGKWTFPFRGWTPLPDDETILAELLAEAGYVSMLICDTPHLVRDGHRFDRGFSAWHWNRGQEGDRAITDDIPVQQPCDPSKQRLPDRHARCHLKWRTAHWQSEADTFAARTMQDACLWLERNYTHERFWLHVDAFDPHEPWDPPRHYRDLYDPGYGGEVVDHPSYDYTDFLTPAELKHCQALYAGEVTLLDTWVGRLLETVEHLGLFDDTAVFFLSDHGHYVGDHGRIGKGGNGPDGPWPFYNEISHMVLLARTPGKAQGTRVPALVQPVDLMPTICDLAGVPVPEGVQGTSLVPLLRGGEIAARPVAVTSPAAGTNRDRMGCVAITDGTWTLQYRGPDHPAELHNVREDPYQQRDLFGEARGEAVRLHQGYLDLLRSAGTDERKTAIRRDLPA